MLDLQTLPEELRDKVAAMMHDACCDMFMHELRKIRLVCVRLAATYYKRCVMAAMLDRYKPFRFPATYGGPENGITRFDLHAYYPNPCTLPKEGWDLYDWQGVYEVSERMYDEGIDNRSMLRLGFDHLRDAHSEGGWRSVASNKLARWRMQQQHYNALHVWLSFHWEPSLFSIAPRPADGGRIEGLDGYNAPCPRPWPWM